MSSADQDVPSRKRKRERRQLESGSYILHSLINDVPLSAEGDDEEIKINCVEFLENNLYIGTSASEILHFVQIPPDPADPMGKPTYILASRLPPDFTEPSNGVKPGVQQILLLPSVNKACILCNSTVTFYSLPELSPVFGTLQVRGCNWIGGIDLNNPQRYADEQSETLGVNVLISLGKRIRVVRIGDEGPPRALRTIDYAGSTISVRRDAFACVADARSYALLDVDRQLKIPLFPISSLDDSQSSSVGGQVEDISGGSRSTSAAPPHSSRRRSTSLNTLLGGTQGRETPDRLLREASPAPPGEQAKSGEQQSSPSKDRNSPDKPLPSPPSESSRAPVYLKPHIVSPSSQEFLLVTGTGPSDPGVGIFVNLDGDVTRSTLEFERYPGTVIADGRGFDVPLTPETIEDSDEGFILATMERKVDGKILQGLEIQRWDVDPGESDRHKSWLTVPSISLDTGESSGASSPRENFNSAQTIGLRIILDAGEIYFDEVVDILKLQRFLPFAPRSEDDVLKGTDDRTAGAVERVAAERALFEAQDGPSQEAALEGWEEIRNQEELQFARRLGQSRSRVAVWSGDSIWWAVRNPLALQMDAAIIKAGNREGSEVANYPYERRQIVEAINSLRGREAKSEAEFVSLGYARQHAGLLFVINMLKSMDEVPPPFEQRVAEEALIEGGLDPRVVLTLIPLFQQEVIEGKNGIWIHGGVKMTADEYLEDTATDTSHNFNEESLPEHILIFLKQFLMDCRQKKGFGSVANESEVYRTVDAALLLVLLQLDQSSPRGPAQAGSTRSDLNDFVDHGVDCFNRAVALLNTHHRLYVLSRLYQSRKMSGEVLNTWRRIVEGEEDRGGELSDGEQDIRIYLTRINNQALVQEYGVWLAARNPKLGVQVFTEDRSRVKIKPTEVVALLREGAPAAVKDYLEHLVFGKNNTEYVNELIAYYLDIVINELESSEESKAILAETYQTYRAMRPPKPTYREFITDNALDKEWWHSRLRLLQLLGGSHQSTSEYDVVAILERISPYTQELVPEVIILDGRQARHHQAIQLLTHGLGDYDTAINYCLLGGSSIYHPISGSIAEERLPTREEQSKLFGLLLEEFLKIDDISDRVEQTGSLLERFGGWLDVGDVLAMIPDSWSVELVSGFLVSALRRIVREKSETTIAKALSGVENLKVSEEMILKIEKVGPTVERDNDQPVGEE